MTRGDVMTRHFCCQPGQTASARFFRAANHVSQYLKGFPLTRYHVGGMEKRYAKPEAQP